MSGWGPRRWLLLIIGIACLAVGATLLVRPFQSLSVLAIVVIVGLLLTGISEIADAPSSREPRAGYAAGAAWIAAAIAIVVWPGLTLGVLALVVGIALVVGGIGRAVAGIRGTTDERLMHLLLGISSIVFGLLALAWPDVTVFVIAAVFGIRMVIFGLSLIVDAIRGPRARAVEADRPGTVARWGRTIAAAAAVLVALALFGVSSRLNASSPTPDAFYDPPHDVGAEPGVLLRSEPFEREIPEGAVAWRILYTTTRGNGEPALASGLVVAPADAGTEPMPLISWAHGTTGVDVSCAPTLLPHPFESGAMFIEDQVIDRGWVMVATDYIGLGADAPHAYLVGEDAGRAVLDAVRAARQLDEVSLADQTVVWGHSQGGGSALWAGILAPTYAPDADVVGVAALSAASNLPAFAGNLDNTLGGSIFESYVITGYAAAYDDVDLDAYVRGSATLMVREMAARCLAEKGILVSIVESLIGDSIWKGDPNRGALAQRLEQNVPTGPIDVPLFMAQGLVDPIVLPEAQAAYVDQRCGAGGMVEYRTYAGFGHVDVVQPGSPLIGDLLAWTDERLAGQPGTSTCP